MKKVYFLLILVFLMSEAFSQIHFVKGFVGGGFNQMNLIFVRAQIDGVGPLESGDEIAVYDGNLCCGVVLLTKTLDPSDSLTFVAFAASSEEAGDQAGFRQGNKMYFRFWDSSAGIEYHNVIPTITDNQGAVIANTFEPNGTKYINATTANTTITWNGGNNTLGPQNWDNPNNWNPKVVPEPFHNVVIPNVSAARYPSIYAGSAASAGSINFTGNIPLTIWSDDTGDGSLIVSNGITGTGKASGMRYLTPGKWHLFSSFSSGQLISDFLTDNFTIPTKDTESRGLISYNESIDNWNSLFTNSSGGSIDLGLGYCVRIDDQGDPTMNNVIFSGSFASGNIQATLSKSNNGWNLLGNPFTSAMYVKQEVHGFLTVNEGKIDPNYLAMYLWDPVSEEYTIINKSEGQSNLALGQGFFVKAAAAGHVTFTQPMQIHETDAPFKSASVQLPSVVLSAKTGDISSSTKINFSEDMTLGLDPGYDAGIFRNGKGFDIYTKLIKDNGVDFMVQALPGKSGDNYIIPVGVDAVKGGEVVFSAQTATLPTGYNFMLEDKLTNTVTNLKNSELYVTNVASETKGNGRFYLHVGSSVQTKISELTKEEILVYTIDQMMFVKGNVSNDAQFMVYSIDGRLINQFGAKSQNLNQMSIAGYTPGIYFVNIQDKVKHKPVKFVVGK